MGFILTTLFAIFAGLGLVVSITGLTKPEILIAFEKKHHKKILRKEFNPTELTTGKVRRMSLILLCVTIILSVSYISMVIDLRLLR